MPRKAASSSFCKIGFDCGSEAVRAPKSLIDGPMVTAAMRYSEASVATWML